jgi:hypothetical protein
VDIGHSTIAFLGELRGFIFFSVPSVLKAYFLALSRPAPDEQGRTTRRPYRSNAIALPIWQMLVDSRIIPPA